MSAKQRKPHVAYRERSANRREGDVYTILAFCRANAISPSKYYSLMREGRGPETLDLDGRVVITPEANEAWRQARLAETRARREAVRTTVPATTAEITA